MKFNSTRPFYSFSSWCCILSFLITCNFCSPILAQDAAFRHYTVVQGLASATVYSGIQDRTGYLWLATESGVNRFNGRNFEYFSVDNGLADSEIFRVYEDRKGRIWFLSFNGKLSYFEKGVFYNEHNAPFLKEAFCGQSLMEIREDAKGRLWITTYGNCLMMVDNDKVEKFTLPATSAGSGGIYVLKPQSGVPEFGFADKVMRYNEQSRQMEAVDDIDLDFISQRPTHSETGDRFDLLKNGILMNYGPHERMIIRKEDSSGVYHFTSCYYSADSMLWAGTMESGIELYSLKGDSAKLVDRYLQDRQISDIIKDTEGNMWICTKDDGLFMMPSLGRNIKVYSAETTFPTGNIYSILVDRSGRIWAGSDRGNVTCIDKQKNTVRQFKFAGKQKNSYRVTDIQEDKEGNMWFATSFNTHKIDPHGVVSTVFNTDNKIPGPRAGKSIAVAGDGAVYVAFYAGVVKYDKKKNGFELLKNQGFPTRTYQVHASREKILVANINGLCEYRNDSLVPLYRKDARLTYRISAIAKAGDSTFIIATHGHGLLVYRNDTIVQVVDNDSDLPSSDCRSVYANGNEIWVVTDLGLSRFYYRDRKLVPAEFNFPSNFPSPNDIRCVYKSGHFLYIGTSTGLYEVDLQYSQGSYPPLKVVLTEFEINNSVAQHGQAADLKYFQNNIGFSFEAISFSHPNNLEYNYRITRDNGSWNSSRGNHVRYSLLPPGQYTFEVRARVAGMAWGPPTKVDFNIRKPLWNETWFYILLFLIGVGMVISPFYLYYRRKIRVRWLQLDKQMAVNRERQRISQDLHDDLGSTLTTILMNTDRIGQKKIRGDEFTRELGEIQKYAADANEKMSEIIWAVSAANDNLPSLVSYLNEFVSDFTERTGIRCIKQFPAEIPPVTIRPEARKNLFLSVKEAFHNIQKHAQASEVQFSLMLNNSILDIVIKDNGRGIDQSKIRDSSIGLASMKSRIANIGGNLVILSTPGMGTEVILRFNFMNEKTLD